MAGILEGVDQRTQATGHNRLELLLFRLSSSQRFGINVFKVKEIIHCPDLIQVPGSHPAVRGITNIRGRTISVIDLSMAIGGVSLMSGSDNFTIITEFNRKIQGFLVGSVDRITQKYWNEVLSPPKGPTEDSYMTAVTDVDGELVQIIDVEKVLMEILGSTDDVSESVVDEQNVVMHTRQVMVVDDSSVARAQVKRVLDQLGVECILCRNGEQALEQLRTWLKEGVVLKDRLAMVISDVEMPTMDGYTFTAEIRRDPALAEIHVVLHTSMSGTFNQSMVERVNADQFLAKYEPNELAKLVLERLNTDQSDSVAA
ncbi:MAG: chemotaxis protein CheV [Gammaproteobacteria bacterium]|nr:chemotaxis protein CheV [Gammaproteobacteria bacterium]